MIIYVCVYCLRVYVISLNDFVTHNYYWGTYYFESSTINISALFQSRVSRIYFTITITYEHIVSSKIIIVNCENYKIF